VSIDPSNERRFTVYIEKEVASAKTITCNFAIYPRHHYDPQNWLGSYTFEDLKIDSIGGEAALFGQRFNSSTLSRDSVMGSGCYYLASWTSGQSMVLKKSEDWWTKDILQANPDKITYVIVPDETTAITLLKSGEVDIMSRVNPTVFAELRADSSEDLAFHTPAIMQYYYLALNNGGSRLKDKKVRRALAHLLDLDQLSKILMADLAQPIAGPIHPSKSYYNTDLTPIPFDPEKSKTLLSEAGWVDTDGNALVDKMIDGKRQDLSLDILVTQKQLGQNLARILKENAEKVGIEINIQVQEWGQILKKISARDFDIVAMATRQAPGIDDLYQGWHTAGIGPDGRNVCGFGTEISDSLIVELRSTEDVGKRDVLFKEIQSIIYDEQPMIFLFAPTETIICRKDLDLIISSRRPGYFETTAKFK
jgi:peptide/nickel transport system substrate-binding protein